MKFFIIGGKLLLGTLAGVVITLVISIRIIPDVGLHLLPPTPTYEYAGFYGFLVTLTFLVWRNYASNSR